VLGNAFFTPAIIGEKLIIDRYIIREIVKPTVAICTALIFIYGCFIGTRYLADAVSGQIPGSIVIILILLRISISLEVLLPTTLYLSVIIAMGRLYKDSEMTALSACGVSTSRVMRPVFFTSLVIALIVSSLSLYIRPWAYSQFFRIKEQAKANFDLKRMKGGTFYEIDNGTRVIFADQVDQKQIQVRKVFIQTERDDRLQIIQAGQASQHTDSATGKQILVFTNGYLHEFSRFGKEGRVIQFEQSAMSLEPKENIDLKYKIKAASTGSLAHSDNNQEIAEFQWRVSTPLATILLACTDNFCLPQPWCHCEKVCRTGSVGPFARYLVGSDPAGGAVVYFALAFNPGVSLAQSLNAV
jgi:lipopolysaccharide export system permease protein